MHRLRELLCGGEIRRHELEPLIELVIAMAATISDLQSALSTQQAAISDLQTQVHALQSPTPAPDLQPVLDGINANTDAVKAISAGLPPVAPSVMPAQ